MFSVLGSVLPGTRVAPIIWAAVFIPAAVWNVFRIIDPVTTRRWVNRYWFRFPCGSLLPPRLDPAVVEQSRAQRTWERVEAVVWLIAIALLLYFTLPMMWRRSS